MKARKKPVIVDADQWFRNGDHPYDYENDPEAAANRWEGKVVRYFRRPSLHGDTPCEHCKLTMHEHGWIDTLEGGHIVCPGDFIITGVKGERYPIKPDIFDATYEMVA